MVTIRNIFLLIIFSVLLTCCEITKTVEVDMPFEGSKIVVLGMVSESELHPIYLSKTTHPLSTESDSLTGCDVSFFENDVLIGKLIKKSDYLYILEESAAFTPNTENSYSVKVKADGLDEATSVPISFPKLVEIDSLQVSPIASDPLTLNLSVFFTDPIEDNFYALGIERYVDGELADVFFDYEVFSPYSTFDDNLFQGSSTNKMVKVNLEGDINHPKPIDIKVTLFSIPKETFDFYWSVREQSATLRNFYMEPSYVNNTINGGYGHFGAYRSSTKWINYP
ncbi:MAG TPA: DUF4249 family protein [Tenuifilaceae bacterium]|nr:DUF4249 family protein [Tenuifilaceae bacterium]